MAPLPAVRDDQLYLTRDAAPMQVGAPPWFAWLAEARSFTFAGPVGSFTARQEERTGRRFWYAYRQRDRVLHKTYLGRSADLTLQRLEQAAQVLAQPGRNKLRAAALDDSSFPLVATKIIVPQPGPSLVARPAVVARCLESMERPCTLLAAPAGFGKTTLLLMACERLKERGWAVAWVSLEEAERDPVRFWRYVLAALDGVQPGIGSVARHLLATLRPPPIERPLTVLINSLAAATRPIALVLDDYHRAATAASDQGLTFLIEHAPAGLHLVVATRADPMFPLTRLRAQGRIGELHAADLRFSAEEATRFLRETMHVSLPDDQLAQLAQRTEGWVAGLQLAALSLHDQANMPDQVAGGTATPRYLAEYLLDEVLEQQPADIQAFLLQTAPLERLTGPLCDAVTGRTDSASILARLLQAHLFLTPLDPGQTSYRYHQLFAETLCERLQRTAPALLEQGHRRAAAWLQQHGMSSEAIRHLLAAQAFGEAVTLIEGESDQLILRGEATGLVAWVRAVPREVVLTHPHLSVLFAGALLMQGAEAEATRWLDELEQHLTKTGTRSAETEGELAVARAFLLLEAGELDQGVLLAQQAAQQLSPGNQLLRALALWITNILGVLGEQDLFEVEQTMSAIAEESLRAGNLLVAFLALITKADIELYQGRLHRAAHTSREALQLMAQTDGQERFFTAMAFCLLGEIKREWNDLEGAERDLRHALAIGLYPSNAEFPVEGPISLALVLAARGNTDEALAIFEEVRSQSQIHQKIAVWDRIQIESMQVRVLLTVGELAEAARWAEACQRSRQLTPSPALVLFRELEELAFARVALAQGHAAEAVRPLEALCTRATRAGRGRNVLEAKMLLARARWMQGEMEEAFRELEASLALAAPEGVLRVFLDEGEALADVLVSYVACRPASCERTHALKLLAAFGRAGEVSRLPQVEALSPRELDVLRLLATGRSNEAIASELVVALSTVKWHLAQISRKLGVTGRVQVIARAHELHLLA